MLRKKARELLVDDKKRTRLARFLSVVALFGVLWFFSGPYYAGDVFTSENALKDNFL
jgi:hypothetical protein